VIETVRVTSLKKYIRDIYGKRQRAEVWGGVDQTYSYLPSRKALSLPLDWSSFPIGPILHRIGGSVGLQAAGCTPRRYTLDVVTHLSTNRAQRRST